MSTRGEVLVAIINNRHDLASARERRWYRIPVGSARKWLKERWPPRWLAFYQTKIFNADAYAVRYYARVLEVRQRYRWELLHVDRRDYRRGQPVEQYQQKSN
jgi:hypothetical protein